jgi:23S rRNA U2552 (ribose-2'-O)-methylase RlmE/FtsJ
VRIVPTFVIRMWLPDRPGALGQVASRIGAVRGDVVGIDILERENGQAVDELVVELPAAGLLDLLVAEVRQVDGVAVEEVRPVADARHDPRLDALEAAAQLVGADGIDDLLDAVVGHAGRVVGAAWVAVTDLEGQSAAEHTLVASDDAPNRAWLEAFLAGSRAAERAGGRGDRQGRGSGAGDVVWAPLPQSGLALVLGREGMPYRARERRQVAALARVVDTRLRELRRTPSRTHHPSR